MTIDGYPLYYTEKLWSWIPGFYREEDAGTDTPGTLRGIVESLGEESARVRRHLDRLWENNFVELADDDVLATLGELLSTRMVHELNRRARRVDVARTIYYRRRAGTPWVLERLLSDIAGWTGCHLDTRRRLARTHHLLEPRPQPLPVTRTLRGGWANLHSSRIPALGATAFEELSHTPDVRRHGRYGIAKIGVHVHRTRVLPVRSPTVVQIGPEPEPGDPWKFALDPSGRAVPLFQPADRPTGESWTRPREWHMPRAIDRRLLAHAEYEWTKADIAALGGSLTAGAVTMLQAYSGWRVRSTLELERMISSFPSGADKDSILANLALLEASTLVADCGSARLYGSAVLLGIGEDNTGVALTRQQVLVANLREWGSNLAPTLLDDYELILDPTTGTAISKTTTATDRLLAPLVHYGAAAEFGAGSYDRRASVVSEGVNALPDGGDALGPIAMSPSGLVAVIDEITNSKTYTPPNLIDEVEDYRLQAANLQRPYLLVSNNDATWTISAKAKAPGQVRRLVLDGLWIGTEDADAELPVELDDPGDPSPLVEGKLVLTGTWDRVEIRHCTLDLGGERIRAVPDECVPIPYVVLELAGYVEELIIDSSIVGPILATAAGNPCAVGTITIRDSVVLTPDFGAVPAISAAFATVRVERSSIGGNLIANRLYASDSLLVGSPTIADLQRGCFRFSAGLPGAWPRPYEAYFVADPSSAGMWFETAVLGQPGFLRMTERAPVEVRTGAENHGEMGVYNRLIEQIRRADLRSKLAEFTPFDSIEQIVIEN